MKRVVDVVVAVAGCVVLSPLLLAAAGAVALIDGFPVLFRQERVGWQGRSFVLLKFRTMASRPGAERGSFDVGCRNRVTGLGRWLRRTKIDELPQLWNVVRGEMSMVGPRPEVRRWVEEYPGRWARVHSVRPGITDPASIEFRNEEELLATSPDPERKYRDEVLPRKLDLYEAYVRDRSLRGDFGIMLRTVVALWRGR